MDKRKYISAIDPYILILYLFLIYTPQNKQTNKKLSDMNIYFLIMIFFKLCPAYPEDKKNNLKTLKGSLVQPQQYITTINRSKSPILLIYMLLLLSFTWRLNSQEEIR